MQETKLFEVPAEVLDDADMLRDWALRAIYTSGKKQSKKTRIKPPLPGPVNSKIGTRSC